jgi:hypothetical protein
MMAAPISGDTAFAVVIDTASPNPPAGRNHQNAEQETTPKGTPERSARARVRQNCLRNDEGRGDREADSER